MQSYQVHTVRYTILLCTDINGDTDPHILILTKHCETAWTPRAFSVSSCGPGEPSAVSLPGAPAADSELYSPAAKEGRDCV